MIARCVLESRLGDVQQHYSRLADVVVVDVSAFETRTGQHADSERNERMEATVRTIGEISPAAWSCRTTVAPGDGVRRLADHEEGVRAQN